MDLLGAESRKTGTRGGRADFTWHSVNPAERQYYLGNSVAAPPTNRRSAAARRDHDWYVRPVSQLPQPRPTATPSVPAVSPSASSALGTASRAHETAAQKGAALPDASDVQAVRKREKAIMDQMIVGRSFSDAVRSALAESVGSGVDDEGDREDAATAVAASRAVLRRAEKSEKAQRKEMRKRARELRRVRRAERRKRRERQPGVDVPPGGSTESEQESLRSRLNDDATRRRRRRGRDCETSKKRSVWTSDSASHDSEGHRARRQRVR